MEQTYRELVTRGVDFVEPPRMEPWGTSAVFRDPDGDQFVLSSR